MPLIFESLMFLSEGIPYVTCWKKKLLRLRQRLGTLLVPTPACLEAVEASGLSNILVPFSAIAVISYTPNAPQNDTGSC